MSEEVFCNELNWRPNVGLCKSVKCKYYRTLPVCVSVFMFTLVVSESTVVGSVFVAGWLVVGPGTISRPRCYF